MVGLHMPRKAKIRREADSIHDNSQGKEVRLLRSYNFERAEVARLLCCSEAVSLRWSLTWNSTGMPER